MKTLHALTCGEWKRWLEEHHESESEVWLVFDKRHTGRAAIPYDDAVREALCFGWIDSLVKRLDDDRYARKFTPRKPGSRWSPANRKRYAQLRASGRLTAAGKRRAPGGPIADAARPSQAAAPQYILDALASVPSARKHFEALAPSYRRMYIGWIDSAKRDETKRRRLQEAIVLLAAGKKLGLK